MTFTMEEIAAQKYAEKSMPEIACTLSCEIVLYELEDEMD